MAVDPAVTYTSWISETYLVFALCMHKCLCRLTHTHARAHLRAYTYLYFASQLEVIPNLNDYRIIETWVSIFLHVCFCFFPYFGRCFYHLFCFPLNRCYLYIVTYITLKSVESPTIIWNVFCGLCIRRKNISHECLNRSMYCDGVKWSKYVSRVKKCKSRKVVLY